jgi:hypothetical protein
VYEPQIRPTVMNPQERRQLVQKAKADRLAYEAAEFLSHGDTAKAATLAGESRALAGPEQTDHWLRRYAIAKFHLTKGAVDRFLDGMPPADIAV